MRVDKITMHPVIHPTLISGNVYRLDVLGTEGVNIDWDRTRWYIHDGNQEVVVKQGAEITHAFAVRAELMGYPVVAEMFLKGDSKPFIDYITVDVGGNELIPIIETLTDEDVEGAVLLSAESSVGSNIDWPQCKWTILETAQTLYGPVVSYKFPSNAVDKQYTVTLTLFRKHNNGEVESKTSAPTLLTVTADPVVPRIKAWVEDKTLILSAEKSTGRGLLLDRAVWSFPGEGDSVSEHIEGGTIKNESWQNQNISNVNIKAGLGIPFLENIFNFGLDISGTQTSTQTNGETTTDYSGYTNKDLTSSNMHTGPICRRYVGTATTQIVTLHVYRMTPEGGVEGKSITVNVDISKAESLAGSGGVDYE